MVGLADLDDTLKDLAESVDDQVAEQSVVPRDRGAGPVTINVEREKR